MTSSITKRHGSAGRALVAMEANNRFVSTDDVPQSASESVRNIFASVQERIALLEREQAALEIAEAQLRDVQKRLTIEQQRSHEVHRDFLESSIHSNSIDLEINKMRDKLRDRRAQTAKLKLSEAEITDHIEQQEMEWKTKYEVELARHEGNLEIYKTYLLGVVQAHADREQHRNNKREAATQLAARMKEEYELILDAQNDTQADITRLLESEDETNQQVEALARQVRTALDERSALRSSFRDAQRAHKLANEETERLGCEYRDMSRA